MRRTVSHALALIVAVLAVLLATPGHAEKRMSDTERGAMLYERHCVQCHGVEAGGDGPATAALTFDVPDLRGALEKSDREANAALVIEGRGAMPSFAVSMDKYDARRTIRHMERASRGELEQPDDEEDEAEATDEGDEDVGNEAGAGEGDDEAGGDE